MQQIDGARLESDVDYRVGYVGDFMGIDDDDVAAIH